MNEVRKLRSKTGAFTKIIEINAPIRFYWTEEGFDGIEATFNSKLLTPYQNRLFDEILDAVCTGMALRDDETDKVPKVIKQDFPERL